MVQAQTPREQRFARALDREIAPVWHDRFARLLYRHLPTHDGVFALDVHSGAGRSTYELLDRLGPNSRVLGLEADETLRGMAKARMEAAWKDRVYFRAGDLTDIADMAEDTYDLVVANLVLSEVNDLAQVVAEFKRVVKPGGRIVATLPISGTWAEVEDLFQGVLSDNNRSDAARRLRRLGRLRKTGPGIAEVAASVGIPAGNVIVEQERFSLLFNSGREFLFSPMVEHGPLRAWKAIVNNAEQQQALFWQLKEAIDTYYADSVFAVTIIAGVMVLGVPEDNGTSAQGASVAAAYWQQYPDLTALFDRADRGGFETEQDDDEFDFDIDDSGSDDDGEDEVQDDPIPGAAEDAEVVSAPPPSRPPPQPPTASSSLLAMSDEDAAIFALLDSTPMPQQDTELDDLLDQVLEFANAPDARVADAVELEPEELEEIVPLDAGTTQGDTLSRIQALLPPPPQASSRPPAAVPRRRTPPPPPPPRNKKKKR